MISFFFLFFYSAVSLPNCNPNFNIDCTACMGSFYGFDCHLLSSNDLCGSHGTPQVNGVVNTNTLTATSLTCVCDAGFSGSTCQYYCPSSDLRACSGMSSPSTCQPLLIRSTGKLNFVQIGYRRYLTGFWDTESGEGFLGLLKLHELTSSTSRMYSIKVTSGSRVLECLDFRVHGYGSGFYATYGDCTGDSSLISYLPEKYSPFSAADKKPYDSTDCAGIKGGGWWYDRSSCLDTTSPVGTFDSALGRSTCLGNPAYVDYYDAHLGGAAVNCPIDVDSPLVISLCEYSHREQCTEGIVREKGNVRFSRGMSEYVDGFGDCENSDCFRGLDFFRTLTEHNFVPLTAKFETEYLGELKKAECKFLVGPPPTYVLTLENCESDDGFPVDALEYNSGSPFTTQDMGGDQASCSELSGGAGYWFKPAPDCSLVNPTGKFGYSGFSYQGIHFGDWVPITESASRFRMELCGSVPFTDRVDAIGKEEAKGGGCRSLFSRGRGNESTVFSDVEFEDFVNGINLQEGGCESGSDCWLGLDKMRDLANEDYPVKLFVELEVAGEYHSIECYDFWLGESADDYEFHVSKCYGSYELSELFEDASGSKFETQECSNGWWSGFHDCWSPTVPEMISVFTSRGRAIDSIKMSACGYFQEEITRKEQFVRCQNFLQRRDGQQSFEKDEKSYIHGFGDCEDDSKNCWLGLRYLNQITEVPQFVEIHTSYNDTSYTFHCGYFQVGGAGDSYSLQLANCGGDLSGRFQDGSLLSDDFFAHNEMQFYAYDSLLSDGNSFGFNPARKLRGGWWYRIDEEANNKFHPTGIYGSRIEREGMILEKLTQFSFMDEDEYEVVINDSLWDIDMMVCSLQQRTVDPIVFTKNSQTITEIRSCRSDCSHLKGATIDVRKGEQVFFFGSKNYEGNYINVATGPKAAFLVPYDTESFYSSRIRSPVLFKENYLSFLDDQGEPSEMLYVNFDQCSDLMECGIASVGSAFIPEDYLMTFLDQAGAAVSAGANYFELGGGNPGGVVDNTISFDVQSFVLEYMPNMTQTEYPVMYELPDFGGKKLQLKYDCPSECLPDGFTGFGSINVIEGYVVVLYDQTNLKGTHKLLVGPVQIERMDGVFAGSPVLSYQSDVVKVSHVEILILEMNLQSGGNEASTNLTNFVVNNPTPMIREMIFTDTYEEYEEMSWSGFSESTIVDGEEIETNVVTSEMTTSSSGFGMGNFEQFHGESEIEARAYAKFVLIFTATAEGSVDTEHVQNIIDSRETTEIDTTETNHQTSKFLETFNKVQSGNIQGEKNTRSFTYTCIAQPWTRTTCTAQQVRGTMYVNYKAVRRMYYTDGSVVDVEFEHTMESSYASTISFNTRENTLNSCKFAFKEYQRDCYKGVSVAEENEINKYVGSMAPPSTTLFKPMGFIQANDFCYVHQGSVPTSVHSMGENYFVQKLCKDLQPTMIGLYYDVEENELKNLDGSSVDFTNFESNTQVPSENSYVVVGDNGFWEYVPVSKEPFAKCIVCKKDLNMQITVPFDQYDY